MEDWHYGEHWGAGPFTPGSLWLGFSHDTADLDRDGVRSLYEYLGRWLNVTPAPVQAPADPVTMTGLRELLRDVLPLHQSPQARYVDAGGDAASPYFTNFPTADPEPHDVGHCACSDPSATPLCPAPVADVTETCELVRPLHANQDDRCGQCGFKWLDHRAAGEAPECTACGHAYRSHFAGGCLAFIKCECPRYRSTR